MKDSVASITIRFDTSKPHYKKLIDTMIKKEYLNVAELNKILKGSKVVISQMTFEGPWKPDIISPEFHYISVSQGGGEKIPDEDAF